VGEDPQHGPFSVENVPPMRERKSEDRMIHIIHNWGEWQYAGEIRGISRHVGKQLLFEEEDLTTLGSYWEIGCSECPKIKGRSVYDALSS
jgi:hypothetical protein